MVPVTVHGGTGYPVMDAAPFGEMPRSPLTADDTTQVTAVAPMTAKGWLVPR